MSHLILPRTELARLIRKRRKDGTDRYDEVWDGVYIMAPMANNEHQRLVYGLMKAIEAALGPIPGLELLPGANVSDRREKWRRNYRCPDIVVFLPDRRAVDCGTHWLGGPEFVVEILSPEDRARKKLDFYAKIGVRELLLVDRDPWQLELYRLDAGRLELVGRVDCDSSAGVSSEVLSLGFRLLPGDIRPAIRVDRPADGQNWIV